MVTKSTLTNEEKVWAAVAHGSAILAFWGPIVPLIIWFMQRGRSNYVRIHSLQAMLYQVLSYWLGMTLVIVLMIVMFPLMMPLAAAVEQDGSGGGWIGALFPFIIVLPMMLSMIVYGGIALIGVVASAQGREFRYPLFGAALARKLNYRSEEPAGFSEEAEDQVVAAVSHSTAILLMTGVVTPMVAWITQKDRSPFLRFQALQAAIYQGLGFLAYVAVMIAYFVMFFVGIVLIGASTGLGNNAAPTGAGAAAGLILLFAPMTCMMLVLYIAGPLYHLFAFIAALQTLRGRDYGYPILGNIIRRRMPAAEAT